jgi:hypothetical protein
VANFFFEEAKRIMFFFFFFGGSPVAKFRNSRQISLLDSQKYGGCFNSFLLSCLVCIPYLAKLSFGHFSSITKMGGGGGGGLYIYKNPATNGSVDVANLIIFISKNGGN